MVPKTPYRFQMYMPEDVRDVLREVAHRERLSMTELVYTWIVERLRTYPDGATLPSTEPTSPAR